MPSEKEIILRWFYRQTFKREVFCFDNPLRQAAIDALNKPPLDVEDYLYANVRRLWNGFLESINNDKNCGRFPFFRVIDNTKRRIEWMGQEKRPNVKSKSVNLYLRLKTRPHILRRFEIITSREYEAIGCVACDLLGATHINLTPPSNEGGIDFFALIKTPSWNHVFGGGHRPLRIVGQSKKFFNKIKVS